MTVRMGARPRAARTRYNHAVMLLRRGEGDDRVRAETPLSEALSEAQALGMSQLIGQIEAAAGNTCATIDVAGIAMEVAPTAGDQDGGRRGGLTAREIEVAVRVARGMTNREIGADLTIAKRTVDAHVANILAKLGFTSRTQIATWAVVNGLLTNTQ